MEEQRDCMTTSGADTNQQPHHLAQNDYACAKKEAQSSQSFVAKDGYGTGRDAGW